MMHSAIPRPLAGLCALALALAAGQALAKQPFVLQEIGSYAHSNHFDVGAAEIAAFDATSDRLFVVNGEAGGLDVLDISDPTAPTKIGDTLLVADGEVTSAAVFGNVVAVTASLGDGVNGTLSFFDTVTSNQLGSTIDVGPTPDMVTFTPNGRKILIAHEGEPDYGAGLDPEGSIGIFAPTGGVSASSVATLTGSDMITAGFNAFDADKGALQAAGVRIFGDPDDAQTDPSLSVDLEPEFIAVSADSSTAWVTLQENNALAIVDLNTDAVSRIVPLGLKDHSVSGQGLDASDEDGVINIANWPVKGMYMADAIATYEADGETYLVMANEGDDRGEDERIEDLTLDPTAFPDAATLQTDDAIGRLKVSRLDGDVDGDGDYDELHSFGGRSFTIRDANGDIVFDSGDMIEQKIAELIPDHFNSDNDDPQFDGKSDSQGPEPEGIALGRIGDAILAFVGMEDVGGVMLFDVTDPNDVSFQSYLNDRDFSAEHDDGNAAFDLAALGNTGPEGLLFIAAGDSPIDEPLLIVSYEVTGTTGIYRVSQVPLPAAFWLFGSSVIGLFGLSRLGRRR